MKIQQIRNATIVLTYGGTKFLIGPVFSKKGTFVSSPSFTHKGVKNPITELPLSVEQITKDIDIVIVTHTHTDHWDAKAAEVLNKELPILVQDENDLEVLEKSGFNQVKIAAEKEEINGVSITRRPTQHYVNEETKEVLAELTAGVTDVMGLVFKAKNEKTLYLTGDTIYYKGVEETIEAFNPEVIVVNAGGNTFNIDGNPENGRLLFNASDVYELHKASPQATIIASHMEAINHYLTSREELRDMANEKGFADQLLVPEDGERIDI